MDKTEKSFIWDAVLLLAGILFFIGNIWQNGFSQAFNLSGTVFAFIGLVGVIIIILNSRKNSKGTPQL